MYVTLVVFSNLIKCGNRFLYPTHRQAGDRKTRRFQTGWWYWQGHCKVAGGNDWRNGRGNRCGHNIDDGGEEGPVVKNGVILHGDKRKGIKEWITRYHYGNDSQRKGDAVKAIQTYLGASKGSGTKGEAGEPERAAEERALIKYANDNALWVALSELGTYITEGAEQKIHFYDGADYLFKLADAIFYVTWLDYFNNLLVHNVLFPNTAYSFKGFLLQAGKLYIVVQQPYIVSTEPTNLGNVKEFLAANGFHHKKNNDYYHPCLGIIVEDLHDENVLTRNGILFFVDRVFYLTAAFYTTG
jgi:Serine/Threonine/Tyrosine Kinase found in polyvalent proteins